MKIQTTKSNDKANKFDSHYFVYKFYSGSWSLGLCMFMEVCVKEEAGVLIPRPMSSFRFITKYKLITAYKG